MPPSPGKEAHSPDHRGYHMLWGDFKRTQSHVFLPKDDLNVKQSSALKATFQMWVLIYSDQKPYLPRQNGIGKGIGKTWRLTRNGEWCLILKEEHFLKVMMSPELVLCWQVECISSDCIHFLSPTGFIFCLTSGIFSSQFSLRKGSADGNQYKLKWELSWLIRWKNSIVFSSREKLLGSYI